MSAAAEAACRDGVRARLRRVLSSVDDIDWLTLKEKIALGWLIRQMIRFGSFEAYLKHEQIAKGAKCSTKTVQRMFAKCVAHGFLGWRQRTVAWARGGRRLLSNLYALADPVAVAAATVNWVDKMSGQRLRLFRLRLKPEKKEAAREESPEGFQPLSVTAALLRSRLVGGCGKSALSRPAEGFTGGNGK